MWRRRLDGFRRDRRGIAAVEMSLVGGMLTVALMNAVEVARYAYAARQVSVATQAAAQAAYVACDTVHVPALTRCGELGAATTAAVSSTPLGGSVRLAPISEGYYCVSDAGKLTYMSAADSRPDDCSAVTGDAIAPGLYLRVQTTYSHSRLLGLPTVADAFANPIVRSAWMRMR